MAALDTLSIALPCTASWEAMTGDSARRFCGECGKHVYNLEALTCDEATDLLARPGPAPCVRFSRLLDGRVRTRDRWAALVAVAGLAACTPPTTLFNPLTTAGEPVYVEQSAQAEPVQAEPAQPEPTLIPELQAEPTVGEPPAEPPEALMPTMGSIRRAPPPKPLMGKRSH